jgi:hypothetical protein
LYASRYGTTTGGAQNRRLRGHGDRYDGCDTETTSSALMAAIDHALALYRQPLIWRRLQLQTMSQDFS